MAKDPATTAARSSRFFMPATMSRFTEAFTVTSSRPC